MNVALWIAQGVLAFTFLALGTMKIFVYEKYAALTEKKRSKESAPTGVTRELARFIGVAEIAGAVGVILPMAINVIPELSPWAAVGLAMIMVLAIGFHVRRQESPVAPLIFLLLAAFVALGRFSHWA